MTKREQGIADMINTAKAFGLEWGRERAEAVFDEVQNKISEFKQMHPNEWEAAEQAAKLYEQTRATRREVNEGKQWRAVEPIEE